MKREKVLVECTVNGKEVAEYVDPRESLLDMLRNRLGLTSVKKGCEVGECGACTVIIDGETIDSCIYLAVWAEGKNIRTLEGLEKNGEITRIQEAFIEEGAVQCGFCTPGFIMSATVLLEQGKELTREEIRKKMSGNLCRCTGYQNIVNAVEKVMHVSEPYKLANRAFHPEDSVIDVGGVKIGGGHLAVIAGPCSVESKEQVIEIAKAAKAAGANLLRGGAFKPRTSPYAFQGMGSAGLDILVAAKEATGLPIVSELMDAEYLDEFIEKVDLIQIGARNMQNFDLLKKVGKATKKPILLKRGLSATFQEWIMSAEYIMASGNPNVILCERGVRTFESYTRNTLDLQAVPVIKELTHLPIIIDPSHAGGKWWLVNPMAKAAVAAGCDGLMIEVHNNPEKALCDGPQSLKPAKFEQLMKELKPIADAVGKEI